MVERRDTGAQQENTAGGRNEPRNRPARTGHTRRRAREITRAGAWTGPIASLPGDTPETGSPGAARAAPHPEATVIRPLPRAQQLGTTLPSEVLALSRWLPWIPLPRPGGGMGKVPSLPRRGRLAAVDWRHEGLPWPEALRLAREHRAAGVGVVLQPGDDLTVLDIDGPLDPARLAVLQRLAGYAEVSPSGAGVHLWLAGGLPSSRRRRGAELLAGGFVTVTAAPLPGRGRGLGQLAQALEAYGFGPPGERQRAPDRASVARTSPDEEVLAALYTARNGGRARRLLDGDWGDYPSASEADFAAVRLIRFHTGDAEQIGRLLRASGLNRPKFDQPGYLTRTIARALALGGPTKETPCITTN